MAEDKKTTKPGAVPEYERRNFRRGIIVFFVALFILGSIAWRLGAERTIISGESLLYTP